MKNKFIFAKLISACALIFAMAGQASASNEPNFPACVNPQGAIIANYSSGVHGIVGSVNTYSGSDTVYQSADNTYVQCFCPENTGEGIETDWWNAKSFSEEEIQHYKNLGWIFVPSGKSWGLTSDPYLAKDKTYSCRTSSSTGGTNSTTSSVGGVSVLASTGNMSFLYLNGILAVSFLALGIYLLKKS